MATEGGSGLGTLRSFPLDYRMLLYIPETLRQPYTA